MLTTKHGLLLVALSCLPLVLTGCSRNGDQPELGQVTGTITMDGTPLPGIVVVFVPDNGRPARGKTDQDGKYELTYIRKTRGTKVGHNRVEIAPNEEGDDESEESGDTEDTRPAKPPKKRKKVKVPERYNTDSILQADVLPGENVLDFTLVSK